MPRELAEFARRHAHASGSGRPVELVKFDLVSPISRARLVIMSRELGFVAGDAFRERDAGVVAGLDDDAVQQVLDRDLAVDRREHARCARRRAALPPGVLADDEFVVGLMRPCLSSLKTTSTVISLARLAGGISSSAFFSNRTLPLSASIRIACGAVVWNSPFAGVAAWTGPTPANGAKPSAMAVRAAQAAFVSDGIRNGRRAIMHVLLHKRALRMQGN